MSNIIAEQLVEVMRAILVELREIHWHFEPSHRRFTTQAPKKDATS